MKLRRWSRWRVGAAALAVLAVTVPAAAQPSQGVELVAQQGAAWTARDSDRPGKRDIQMNRTVLMEVPGPPSLKCGQEYRHTEPTEGTLGFRFLCTGKGFLNWDFRLSPTQRAQSPLGPVVNESGMAWTKNGTRMPMNARHTGTPNDYWFHGTLVPVASGDKLTYEDTLVYPNTFGGTTTLKIVGTINLLGF